MCTFKKIKRTKFNKHLSKYKNNITHGTVHNPVTVIRCSEPDILFLAT